jgi:hypothetical protein
MNVEFFPGGRIRWFDLVQHHTALPYEKTVKTHMNSIITQYSKQLTCLPAGDIFEPECIPFLYLQA